MVLPRFWVSLCCRVDKSCDFTQVAKEVGKTPQACEALYLAHSNFLNLDAEMRNQLVFVTMVCGQQKVTLSSPWVERNLYCGWLDALHGFAPVEFAQRCFWTGLHCLSGICTCGSAM
jgi:hypothetical protein